MVVGFLCFKGLKLFMRIVMKILSFLKPKLKLNTLIKIPTNKTHFIDCLFSKSNLTLIQSLIGLL